MRNNLKMQKTQKSFTICSLLELSENLTKAPLQLFLGSKKAKFKRHLAGKSLDIDQV